MMDIITAIEPSLRVSFFFGMATFDKALNRTFKTCCRGWLLFFLSFLLQVSDWYYYITPEITGNIRELIKRYPHDSTIVMVNYFCTIFLILKYDRLTFYSLNKLRRFNMVRLNIDQKKLRRLNFTCKLLSHTVVIFCVVVVGTNAFLWWFMQGSEDFIRFVIYCAGILVRFASYAIITNQIVTYYWLIRLWYQAINDYVTRLTSGGSYKRIRLLAEADKMIKDFNAGLEFIYSVFIFLSCVVALIELIHAFVFFFFNPSTTINELIATFIFVMSLVIQMGFFTVGATSAAKEVTSCLSSLHGGIQMFLCFNSSCCFRLRKRPTTLAIFLCKATTGKPKKR